MIGIEAITHYIPEHTESNLEAKEKFGLNEDFIKNKIGVLKKPRKNENEETSDLCVRSFNALKKKTDITIDEIDCLVVCTQNPDGHGLPHTSAIVHGKLGCQDSVAAFDISLGCSGYVYSLSIITSFMNSNGLKKGLLFTADPYSKIIDPDDKNTSLLFGDAATVTLIGERPKLEIKKTVFGTRGSEGDALQCVDGHLQMNGRSVFNFSMTVVPPQIKKITEESGLGLDELDLLVLHQGSKYIIDMLTKRLGVDPAKVPSNISDMGNTVSSSIPLILENHLDTSEMNILISGFGVGLSWASALLCRC
jgi:3-oxoacyl-[acyl-carrier-protein] synthase III